MNRSRLMLAGLGAVAASLALCLAVWSGRAERQRKHDAMQAVALADAIAVAAEVQRSIAGLQALALSRPLCAGDLHDFRRQAEDFVRQQHPGANLLVTDTTGMQRLNLLAPRSEPLEFRRNLGAVSQVVLSGEPQVSDAYDGTRLQRLVSMDVPVFCAGSMRYVLTLTPPVETLREVLLRQPRPADGTVLLLDSRGEAITALLPGDRTTARLALPGDLRSEDGSGTPPVHLVSRDGATSAVAPVGRLRWSVAVQRPSGGSG